MDTNERPAPNPLPGATTVSSDWRRTRSAGQSLKHQMERQVKDFEATKGKFRWIPKGIIGVDRTYQRNTVKANIIKKIARDFDWRKFGVVLVSERKDGSLVAFDGQHRLEAAKLIDQIRDVPCLIFDSSTVTQEASGFVGVNRDRVLVTSIDKYRASVVAEDERAMNAESVMQTLGLEVRNDRNTSRFLRCPEVLLRIVNIDRGMAISCIKLCLRLTDDRPINRHLLDGLFDLCMKMRRVGVDIITEYGDKMVKYNQNMILTKLRQKQVLAGHKKPSMLIQYVILDIINERKRVKLEMPE